MQNEGNILQGPHSVHVSLLMKKSMQNTNYLSGIWQKVTKYECEIVVYTYKLINIQN